MKGTNFTPSSGAHVASIPVSRGWAKRYSVGFAFSIGLFGLGVAVVDIIDSQALWVWLPYAALTATPLVLASVLRATR